MSASGRFVLRIDPSLHVALRAAAAAAGVSLNEYCARRLMTPDSPGAGPFGGVIARAAGQFGAALRGVVAYGSWVRGEAADGSDIDVLVVVSDEVALERRLYQEWDERAETVEGRRIEAHIVHLPPEGARVTGLWAELAVDGVVLHDPGLDVSRRLVSIRRRIVAGEVVRREVHGQAYWTEAA